MYLCISLFDWQGGMVGLSLTDCKKLCNWMKKGLTKLQRCSFEGMFCVFSAKHLVIGTLWEGVQV